MTVAGDITHRIAVKAAKQIVAEGKAAGLTWSEIMVSCETVMTIVIGTAAMNERQSNRVRFASEIIDSMTYAANERVVGFLKDQN